MAGTDVSIYLGGYFGGTLYGVERIYIHAQYNASGAGENDIGFLKISGVFVYSDVIQPAKIRYDFIQGGINVTMTGYGCPFGILTVACFPSPVLLYANTVTLDNNHTFCNNTANSTTVCTYTDPLSTHPCVDNTCFVSLLLVHFSEFEKKL